MLRKSCLLHGAIEGQMMEIKGLGRSMQFLDVLENKRHWKLKEEVGD